MVFYEAGRVGNNARLGLEDGENLAFGNDIVEFDENRRELARGGRGYRDFHLHGRDEGDVVAIGDAGSASIGSAQMRPATSVTILISSIPVPKGTV